MKNITVSIDDEVYRRARIKAAERDSSVSAIVQQFLVGLATSDEREFDRLKRGERELRATLQASGLRFRAADRLSRDDLHDRHAFR